MNQGKGALLVSLEGFWLLVFNSLLEIPKFPASKRTDTSGAGGRVVYGTDKAADDSPIFYMHIIRLETAPPRVVWFQLGERRVCQITTKAEGTPLCIHIIRQKSVRGAQFAFQWGK